MPLELSTLDLRECILHFNTTLFFRSPHEIMEEMLQRSVLRAAGTSLGHNCQRQGKRTEGEGSTGT